MAIGTGSNATTIDSCTKKTRYFLDLWLSVSLTPKVSPFQTPKRICKRRPAPFWLAAVLRNLALRRDLFSFELTDAEMDTINGLK